MGAYEAGCYLAELLGKPGPARRRWQMYQHARSGAGEVSIAAVCRVIAEYLWDSGEFPDTDTELPRRLKDRVGRALQGRFLNPVTLRWFSDAFELPEDDALRLQLLLDGSPSTRVTIGQASDDVLPPARPCRTLSLHEHHYLGSDGLPSRHLTTQVIEATGNELTVHRYMFDTATLTVDVMQGGCLDGPVHDLGGGMFARDIVLTRPLSKGETATLCYSSAFRYSKPPAPEFRRTAFRRVNNMDLRVEFHPSRLPRQIFYAEWNALHGPPIRRTPVTPAPDCSVHIFLSMAEHVIVGFTWEW